MNSSIRKVCVQLLVVRQNTVYVNMFDEAECYSGGMYAHFISRLWARAGWEHC